MIRKPFLIFLLLILCAAWANANAIYVYQGVAFSDLTNPDGGVAISAVLEFANPLPAGPNNYGTCGFCAADIQYWWMSDGTHTLDSTNGHLADGMVFLDTDVLGNVLYWLMDGFSTANDLELYTTSLPSEAWDYSQSNPNGEDLTLNTTTGNLMSSTTVAGFWTLVGGTSGDPDPPSVPEPSAVLLTLAPLAALMWRKRFTA